MPIYVVYNELHIAVELVRILMAGERVQFFLLSVTAAYTRSGTSRTSPLMWPNELLLRCSFL